MSFGEILFGGPKATFMGPLFFNNFVTDLLLISDNIKTASYIENNSPENSNNTALTTIL